MVLEHLSPDSHPVPQSGSSVPNSDTDAIQLTKDYEFNRNPIHLKNATYQHPSKERPFRAEVKP